MRGNSFIKGILRPFPRQWNRPPVPAIGLFDPRGGSKSWFGAGLRTGRYFSIFCALVMLAALWLTARRLGGKWRAAAVVWAIALTPISIQIYTLAITQALVACLLAGSLFFVLGGWPLWHIIIGAVLAGLTVMTRQNLLPLIPLLVAYVFWQHGKRAGWWALAGCLLPVLIIHVIYWPNILELWAVWLPARLTPFLDPYRLATAYIAGVNGLGIIGRLSAFFQGIRFHYFTTIGFCVCLLLWPNGEDGIVPPTKGWAIFGGPLFGISFDPCLGQFPIPARAVSCTFCFTPYLSFFDIIVLLLIVISIPSWNKTTLPSYSDCHCGFCVAACLQG